MSDTQYLDLDALCNENGRDEVFTLLSNSRRRSVLYVLYQSGHTSDLADLVSEVAAYESGATADELDDEVTQSVYISLYQTHLPKLEEAGLVEHDDEERVVSLTSRARRLLVSDDDLTPPKWHRPYAVLLAGGILIGVGAWFWNGTTTWQLVSVTLLTGLCGVVVAHSRAVDRLDAPLDGSYLAVDDLV